MSWSSLSAAILLELANQSYKVQMIPLATYLLPRGLTHTRTHIIYAHTNTHTYVYTHACTGMHICLNEVKKPAAGMINIL